MNRITVLGRLADAPVKKYTSSGQMVISMRLASNSREGGQDVTVWYDVSMWQDHPLIPHMQKGSAVVVSGELKQPDIWEDRNGQQRISLKVRATDISFSPFGRPKDSNEGGAPQGGMNTREESEPYAASASKAEFGRGSEEMSGSTEDDLPF